MSGSSRRKEVLVENGSGHLTPCICGRRTMERGRGNATIWGGGGEGATTAEAQTPTKARGVMRRKGIWLITR